MSICEKHKNVKAPQICPICLIDENEFLKSYIVCEVDNMAAFAPFDDLGNHKAYVKRAFFTVGHIIPELEELKNEVEITCEDQAHLDSIAQEARK